MTASASAGAAFLGIILIALAIGLYFLPTIIGATRKVVNVGSVFAINLLLGWTLIGWAVALAMALRTNPTYAYPQQPQQILIHQPPMMVTPPPGPPPGWYSDPHGAPVQRWWDGRTWTDRTQEPPALHPTVAPPPFAGAHPGFPAPGWYPDPEGEARVRRWDGAVWTRETMA